MTPPSYFFHLLINNLWSGILFTVTYQMLAWKTPDSLPALYKDYVLHLLGHQHRGQVTSAKRLTYCIWKHHVAVLSRKCGFADELRTRLQKSCVLVRPGERDIFWYYNMWVVGGHVKKQSLESCFPVEANESLQVLKWHYLHLFSFPELQIRGVSRYRKLSLWKPYLELHKSGLITRTYLYNFDPLNPTLI